MARVTSSASRTPVFLGCAAVGYQTFEIYGSFSHPSLIKFILIFYDYYPRIIFAYSQKKNVVGDKSQLVMKRKNSSIIFTIFF